MYDEHMKEAEYCIHVLNRIKEYMNKNALKQSELAKICGINQSTLSKIMKREVKLTLPHIFKLCKTLKVDHSKKGKII